ncbi:signal peptidase I [Terriglobus sp. 2YAB30_2]|uniref:signal peptidase I n=1 Tax=unclassified Terriglobus TaxID=2628988 RepID=UPI003F95EF2D
MPNEEQQPAEPKREETLLESIASIASVLAVGLFVMTFIFQNFEIPSASMVKTLLIGDHVLVDRVTLAPQSKWMPLVHYRQPHRGDVFVFLKPGWPDLFLVKRLVGLPGDKIHLRNGILYVNGVQQNESYISKPGDRDENGSIREYQEFRDDFPLYPPPSYMSSEDVPGVWREDLPAHIQGEDLVVPPGKVFAMGDNRLDSLDSRFWGFVPMENVVGRPMFVYWSFETPADQINKQTVGDRISFAAHVILHFFDETRWKRTLHLVK